MAGPLTLNGRSLATLEIGREREREGLCLSGDKHKIDDYSERGLCIGDTSRSIE